MVLSQNSHPDSYRSGFSKEEPPSLDTLTSQDPPDSCLGSIYPSENSGDHELMAVISNLVSQSLSVCVSVSFCICFCVSFCVFLCLCMPFSDTFSICLFIYLSVSA